MAASRHAGFGADQEGALIEPFDYSTVMTAVQSIFGTQQNIGTGINAMLTKRITQDGHFTVVERRKVNNLMKEQDFDASNRVKKGTGARVGQIRGADLTLMGDIVVFGRDDRRVSGGAGAIVRRRGRCAGGYKQDNKAVVVLDYRIVDAETSEVVASGEARGESKRTSKGFGAAMFVGGVGARRRLEHDQLEFRRDHHRRSHHGRREQALAADINQAPLNGGAGSRENDLDALVADVSGATITINAG